jgi:hypothetical protein
MKKPRIIFTITTLIFCLSSLIVAAQTKPNFTGTWKMNPSKSKFAEGGPSAITIKLEQKDASFSESVTVDTNKGEYTLNLKYNADGKEISNQMGELPLQVSAKWEGEKLIVEMKSKKGLFLRKMEISADGKTITMNVHRTDENGATFDDIVVMEKQ